MRTTRILLLLLLTATSAHAATYYVAPGGSGSCATATNPSAPIGTITAGAGCLNPGDTLIVQDGTYAECLADVIPSGLSAQQPTTIKAAHPRQARLTGPIGPCSDSLIMMGVRGGEKRDYITIDGLFLDIPTDRPGFGIKPMGGADDGSISGSHDLVFQNLEIQGGLNSGNVSSFSIGIGQGGNQYGWTFRNNAFHDIGMVGATPDQAAWSYGLYISGSDNVIAGNTFARISAFGIHGYSTGDHLHRNLICNNTFEALGGPAMLICGSDNRIVNNVINGAGLGPANGSYRGGINLALSCSGVAANNNQILNNTIRGVVSSGAQEGCIALTLPTRGTANGNVVRGNVCYENTDDIINNQVGTNTVEGNHCKGAGCSTDGGPQFATAAATDGSCPAGPPSAKPKLPTPKRLHRVSHP
jgi:hypothetical protein